MCHGTISDRPYKFKIFYNYFTPTYYAISSMSLFRIILGVRIVGFDEIKKVHTHHPIGFRVSYTLKLLTVLKLMLVMKLEKQEERDVAQR